MAPCSLHLKSFYLKPRSPGSILLRAAGSLFLLLATCFMTASQTFTHMWLRHIILPHAATCPDPAQAQDRYVQLLEL